MLFRSGKVSAAWWFAAAARLHQTAASDSQVSVNPVSVVAVTVMSDKFYDIATADNGFLIG